MVKCWEPLDPNMQMSTKYEMFKYLPYNRNLDHVKKIINSIEKIGFIPTPIIVNENMEIIDGQHRFTACKELGLPVYYVIVPGIGIKQCSEINSVSKNWSTTNHVHAYTSPEYEDNDSYIYYELLQLEHPNINTTKLSCMLAPLFKTTGRSVRKILRDGELKLSEDDYKHITEKIAWVESFVSIESKITGSVEDLYLAVSYLYEIKAINRDKLKKCILSDPYSLSPVGDINTCLDSIEKIYNKRLKNKVFMRPEYEKYKAEDRRSK